MYVCILLTNTYIYAVELTYIYSFLTAKPLSESADCCLERSSVEAKLSNFLIVAA